MYMPTLNNKQGELKALFEFEDSDYTKSKKQSILPNIIINDAEQSTLTKIRKKYSSNVLLDTRFLDASDLLALITLLKEEENKKFNILFPLEVVLDEKFTNLIPKEIVKYTKIVNFKTNFKLVYDGLKRQMDKLPENIVIDLGFIIDSSLSKELSQLLELMSKKTVYLLSGSVPKGVPTKSDENYSQDIYEYRLFENALQYANENNIDIEINFADYATVHPITEIESSDGFKGIPIVQIKYTLDNVSYLFVRNGQFKGTYNFRTIAKFITEHRTFQKKSWCDAYLVDILSDDELPTGNPTTWAALSINRHISVFS